METAQGIALLGAVGFFLVGLLTGVWKYVHIYRSPEAIAPEYVNICHRSSLLYAFACLLVERMVQVSQLPAHWELGAVVVQLFFFVFAVFSYALHGALRDTDNQFRKPHRLGKLSLPPSLVVFSMLALIAGELGGFLILAVGVAREIF